MIDGVLIHSKYRHYKGNEYYTLAVAIHSETMEKMVVYQALYGERGIWIRPLSMWQETVMINEKIVSRFSLIEE